MPYFRKLPPRQIPRTLQGFGDFNDESPCASIPAGDAYRKPGNYCATADGGYTTFNPDGSVYAFPVAKPPDTSIIGKIGGAILGALTPQPPVYPPGMYPGMVPTGMSTTTKIALVGGGLLVVALIARRRG
jgi:hypothetical protein